VPEHKIVGAINADAPKRFTKQFLPLSLPTTELVQEVLEIAGRRLFVPFQPKEPRDFVVAEGVHAKYWLVRQIASLLR
jgi:hypothetical protein